MRTKCVHWKTDDWKGIDEHAEVADEEVGKDGKKILSRTDGGD